MKVGEILAEGGIENIIDRDDEKLRGGQRLPVRGPNRHRTRQRIRVTKLKFQYNQWNDDDRRPSTLNDCRQLERKTLPTPGRKDKKNILVSSEDDIYGQLLSLLPEGGTFAMQLGEGILDPLIH